MKLLHKVDLSNTLLHPEAVEACSKEEAKRNRGNEKYSNYFLGLFKTKKSEKEKD